MDIGNTISVLETFYENQIDIAADGQAPAPMTDMDYIAEVLVDAEGVDEPIAKLLGRLVNEKCYHYADTHNLIKVIRRGIGRPDETIVIYSGQDLLASFGMGKRLDDEIEIVIMGIQARYPKSIWL